MRKKKKCWKYCTSVSCIMTGTILTTALHKQGCFTTIACLIIVLIGIICHIKIMKKDLNTSLKNFVIFLAHFVMLLTAMLFTSFIRTSIKNPIFVSIFAVFTVTFFFFSIRYFSNLIYCLVLYLKTFLREKEKEENKGQKKIDYTMWIVSLFSALATIFSLFVSIAGTFSQFI